MTKLYINPAPNRGENYLQRIIARLHGAGYHPVIIGHGHPPIFVVAPRSQHGTIMQRVREIDPDSKFSYFRADMDGLNGVCLNAEGNLEQIMTRFDIPVAQETPSLVL